MGYISHDENDPNAEFPKAYANAQTNYSSKKYKEAIVDLSKAIEIQPKYANSYLLRGMCQAQLKNLNGACAEWRKAELLGSESGTRMLKQYCYKTSPKTEKRKSDIEVAINVSEPITRKSLDEFSKVFKKSIEKQAEKEKENDKTILIVMLFIIIMFLLIFGLTIAGR